MHGRRTASLFPLLTLLLLLTPGFLSNSQAESPAQRNPVNAEAQLVTKASSGLERSQVCFINDQFMGKPQIPVTVDGKTYYGCCRGCADSLRTDRSTRFATDPQTGSEVDKATAFIAVDPSDSGKVLYFKSAETYRVYLRKTK